jgi:hypothetical protein
MAVFLLVVAGVVASLHDGLQHAFDNNVGLNSLILGVLLVGVILNFRQVAMLTREVAWVEECRRGGPITSSTSPRLLAPLATMLGERRDRFNLTPLALRSLLDGLNSRLDESREIAHYFTGLMIFLGLLGTFWGLSQTVGSIGDVIRSLTISGDDVQGAFATLKQGLDAPLSGMGTAFSTSLIGLSGSLVLGFLDLQAGQAQNAFYNDLEEWLSSQTRIGGGNAMPTAEPGESGSGQPVPAYIQALLEQTADSLDNLQRTMARGEEGRISANTNMRALTDRLSALADSMKTEQSLMLKLAENQLEMKPLLARMAEVKAAPAIDDTTRNHIRNIDLTLTRLAEDMTRGRDEVVRDMRGEFRFLARTIAALAEGETEPAPTSFREP